MKKHIIKKAIIPLAGYGTRMYPLTKCIKKAFLPVYRDKILEPLIIHLLVELNKADIEEIALVISKNEKESYEEVFKEPNQKIYEKLSPKAKKYEEILEKISKKIKYIEQEEPLGFGHAVYLTKEFAENEPVLLLLGDTVYSSKQQLSCTDQLLNQYDQYQQTMISLKEIQLSEVKYYGVSKGKIENDIVDIEKIIEKPSIQKTKKELLINKKIYGNFGQFIVTNEIYEILDKMVKQNITSNGEIQLTDAYSELVKKHTIKGVIIDGNSYDLGNMNSYQKYLSKNERN